jgi:hypothetical protein
MKDVVFPKAGVHIDLDVDTGFALGLPHINTKLRAGLWPTSLLGNRYTLTMSTDKACTDFINFYKLHCVLRKVISYVSPHGTLRDLTLESGYGGIGRIILVFSLDTETSIDDLRISILPLVMETSSTLGYREVTVRVRCETSTKETSFSLQTLRLNVAKALERVVLLYDQIAEPEIWINGLGEFVETQRKARSAAYFGGSTVFPKTASSFEAVSGDCWKLMRVHPKDTEYKERQGCSGCALRTLEEFFPFHSSASNVVQYLVWVLEEYDIEGWKKSRLE